MEKSNSAGSNFIGGTASGAGNVISGHTLFGINLASGFRQLVQGNFIGTDQSGRFDLGNGSDGVKVLPHNSATIGGTDPGAGNMIEFNGGKGVFDLIATGIPVQPHRQSELWVRL